MASLPVYFEQRLVGTINVDKSGPGFTYDPAWIGLRGAFPISITMPLKSERIASDLHRRVVDNDFGRHKPEHYHVPIDHSFRGDGLE